MNDQTKPTAAGAAAELSQLKKPTAEDVREVFERNGLELSVVDGRLVSPKGITPEMSELLTKHDEKLVALIGGKTAHAKKKATADGIAQVQD
jgi:hypothetical protein